MNNTKRVALVGIHLYCIEGENQYESMIAETFTEADEVLAKWSETAPEGHCYDKVAATALWADGSKHRAEVCISKGKALNLSAHMRAHLEFSAGRAIPELMEEAEYAGMLAAMGGDKRKQAAARLLTGYVLA